MNAATGVAINSGFAVTFSTPMAPSTVTTATFMVTGPGAAAVAGTVSYAGLTATFQSASTLASGTLFTATITTGAKDLAGNALAANHAWSFTTGFASDTTPPTVASTSPLPSMAGVLTTAVVKATFSEAMAPQTVTAATFALTGPGGAAVPGSVVFDAPNKVATFQPAIALAVNTNYLAKVKGGAGGATDLAGNALATDYSWAFTTGAAPDTTPPTVVLTNPLPAATGVLTTAAIQATFSEAMAPLTISNSTFTLTGPGAAAVPGSVVFDGPNKVATFLVATSLAANTNYLVKLQGGAGGVTDLAGNALSSDYSWAFTTGAHVGLSPVFLGSAANYVILAKSAISTVPDSVVTGDVALSPAAASYITGFGQTDAIGYSTSPQVIGKIWASDYAPPTPSNLTTAVSDMETAYTDAAGRPTPDFLELNTGAIGGLTLSPGLYKWTGTVTIPSDVTLNGSATDVWILQISGDLTMSAAKKVSLTGGALAKNVFWQVAGMVDIGTNAHFEGIILSKTAITLETAASMNGRALAQTAVVLQSATVTQPAP